MDDPFDYDVAAAVFGVDRATLPKDESACVATPPLREPRLNFSPLSDSEWAVVQPALPQLPIPKPTEFRDRDFIDSVLWWQAARDRKLGWSFLPAHLGPVSSRQHRHARWVQLGYWRQLADALEGRLSEPRQREFERLAVDAESRRSRILSARERMTDPH